MALLKKITLNPTTRLYLWHTTETEDELRKGVVLSEYCRNRLKEMKVPQMRCNFLAVRQILATEGVLSQLQYNELGKPFFSDGSYLSVSHSGKYVAVILSDSEVGIDMEERREKLLSVASKFTSWDKENVVLSKQNALLKLAKVWTAKEAIYKIHGQAGLDLKGQILLRNFFPSDLKVEGRVVIAPERFSDYQVYFMDQEVENYVIAYCFRK